MIKKLLKRAWRLSSQKYMYKNLEAEVHRQKAEEVNSH